MTLISSSLTSSNGVETLVSSLPQRTGGNGQQENFCCPEEVFNRCLEEYRRVLLDNPNIDAGHSMNHVIRTARISAEAMSELRAMKVSDGSILVSEGTAGRIGQEIPADAEMRITVAALLHEIGDEKVMGRRYSGPAKNGLIENAVRRVLTGTESNGERDKSLELESRDYLEELGTDICNMISLCSASNWGDRIPEWMPVNVYTLIPRWADRLEATGVIGIARCLTYAFTNRHKYPLVLDTDPFPTTQAELDNMSPIDKWFEYSRGKKSTSGWSHFHDKVRHIGTSRIPLPLLQIKFDERRSIVDKFILDFTNVNGRRFNIEWVLQNLSDAEYPDETEGLREMTRVLQCEGCKWITPTVISK